MAYVKPAISAHFWETGSKFMRKPNLLCLISFNNSSVTLESFPPPIGMMQSDNSFSSFSGSNFGPCEII